MFKVLREAHSLDLRTMYELSPISTARVTPLRFDLRKDGRLATRRDYFYPNGNTTPMNGVLVFSYTGKGPCLAAWPLVTAFSP